MLKNDISKTTIVTSIIVIQSSLDLDEKYLMRYIYEIYRKKMFYVVIQLHQQGVKIHDKPSKG